MTTDGQKAEDQFEENELQDDDFLDDADMESDEFDDSDFDDTSFDESDDFSDDDEWDESGESEENAPAAKKKSISNVIVIAGCAVVGVIVLLFLMGGGDNPPAPNPGQMQQAARPQTALPQKTAQEPTRQEQQAAPPAPAMESGFLNSPDALAALQAQNKTKDTTEYVEFEEEETFPPMPAQMTQDEAFSKEPLTPMPPPAAPVETATAEAPAAVQPPQTPVMNKPAQKAPTAPVTVQPATINNTAMDDLQNKLSTLIDRLDSMENRIDTLARQKNAPGNSTSSEDLTAIRSFMKTLETRFDNLDKAQKEQAAKLAKVAAAKPVREETPKAEKVTTPRVTAKPEAQIKASAPTPAVSPVTVSWTLRSVQPGEAYVAQKGSSDMVRVKVGDTLPGIGEITDIGNASGTWVVQGTQGKITP